MTPEVVCKILNLQNFHLFMQFLCSLRGLEYSKRPEMKGSSYQESCLQVKSNVLGKEYFK